MGPFISFGFMVLMVVVGVLAWRNRRKRGGRVGAGAAGAFYELLDKDKRSAIEIIVEERSAYRDPETKDGSNRRSRK